MNSADNKLFVCPKCEKTTMSFHRRTYEGTVIVTCSNCRLNEAFEPSKEAIFDFAKCAQEFAKHYNSDQKLKAQQ